MDSTLEQTSNEADARYRGAKYRAEMLQGLYIHILVYLTVNAGLFVINALTRGEGGSWWFWWVAVIWGIGLAIHALATFVPIFSPDWAERRAQQELERDRR